MEGEQIGIENEGVGMEPSPCNMIFSDKDGSEVGRLSWDSGEMIFEGKADESAKIFFEFLNNLFKEEGK